jgi:tRNA(Ile)-lysidine synthetase-like protein
VALMQLAAQWRSGGTPAGTEIFVATVDHGLRAESRAEAETVGLWAQALGLPHQSLTWTGAKPGSRIQERARAARYALLRAHARTLGAGYLLTAHHADDQAETILFRLMRGSGIGGLAGMQGMTRRDGIVLYRPLLGLPKRRLIEHCDACDCAPFFQSSTRQGLMQQAWRGSGAARRGPSARWPRRPRSPAQSSPGRRRPIFSIFPPRACAICRKRFCYASWVVRSPIWAARRCGSNGSKV